MYRSVSAKTTCYHCGEDCREDIIHHDEKDFCCEGCKTVYDILSKSEMCEYYTLNDNPGKTRRDKTNGRYEFLNDEETAANFITFKDDKQYHVRFTIPAIHCSSCIWLLENLNRLNPKVQSSRVNFVRKEIAVIANNDLPLSELALLMDKIGYPPKMSLNELGKNQSSGSYFDKKYFYKLGIAFFSFGNIMLLSFPEYFGIESVNELGYRSLFNYLNLVLALPVMFYCSTEFFRNAWNGLRVKQLNMDFPIALGILTMFIRSLYEIISGSGSGYLDSLSGLVFLMLVGRALQNLTYGKISFDHDYKSYFPLSVTVIENGEEKNMVATKIKPGQRLLVRNQELIPADAILFKGDAKIDYSFVTGESLPVDKTLGEIIFAGGRQMGNAIEVEVIREVSQSYLTRLWNEEGGSSEIENDKISGLSNRISTYFSIIILLIATGAALYWLRDDAGRAIHAFTSVLIITCPCALALSAPFTLANTVGKFGLHKFYLKKPLVVEKLAEIDTIIFDKTGTLTNSQQQEMTYYGEKLTAEILSIIRTLVKNSNHPLSRNIYRQLKVNTVTMDSFDEIAGKGMSGTYQGIHVKIGNIYWLAPENVTGRIKNQGSTVGISVNGHFAGYFVLEQQYRSHLNDVVLELKKKNTLLVLSGDNESERNNLETIFGADTRIAFNQTPFDKMETVKKLQNEGKHVMMIGDGLNDAGALRQSDVGIAVSDDINNFSPACDGILDAQSFTLLPKFIRAAKWSYGIIIASFVLSFIYNIIGLYFATQGNVSPIIAAILMPASSISIIVFTTGSTHLITRRILI